MGIVRAICFLLLASAPLVARAQQPGPNATQEERAAMSRQHFETGMAHFHLEEWDQAVDEWEQGFRIKPVPQFLYNIAQAYRLSKRAEKALSFYQKYLRIEPRAENRAEVERHIAQLNKLLDEQKKSTNAPPIAPMPTDPTATAQPQPVNKGIKGQMAIPRDRPLAIEKPVLVEKPVEKPILVEKPVAVIDRPVAVEKPGNLIVRDPGLIKRIGEPPIQTPVTTTTPVTTPATSATVAAAPADNTPIYKKAWFWSVLGGGLVAIIGAVVAGVLVPGSGDAAKILPKVMF